MRRVPKAEALALVERAAAELDASHRGCVMCALSAPSNACETLASNEVAVAVLERFAIRRGHVIIVLRRHAERIVELSWDEWRAVQRLAWEATRALQAVLDPKRIFVASLGAPAPIATSFPHHHVHVIPLYDGGPADRPAEVLTWEHGVCVYEANEAITLRHALRAAWTSDAARP
jgi:diadenosine tetraphosphate (Ap4A) HIT family hydrolase